MKLFCVACQSCDWLFRDSNPALSMAAPKNHRKACPREPDGRRVRFIYFTEEEKKA